ncbi:NAD(P)H-binding protein [candidate division KSB1 bacterium]|nr:NAD(P)H-binding protein [candidate division KSB1 bacterium]
MYVIMGSSGNIGKLIATTLLKSGKQVRVISRDMSKVQDLVDQGAESVIGKISNIRLLRDAFKGAKAVYAMIPTNSWTNNYRAFQNGIARNIARAIETAGVKYVVALSGVGAHLQEKGGIVQGLYDMENRFNDVDALNVLYLRPSTFMENLLGQIHSIKQLGVMASAVKADLKFSVVATRDIAKAAADRLLRLNFKGAGNIQYILGPRELTYVEIARILGRAIDLPDLQYVELSYSDAKHDMIQRMGTSENVAETMIEYFETMNTGRLFNDVKRTFENTTLTSLEDFAPVFARAYHNH